MLECPNISNLCQLHLGILLRHEETRILTTSVKICGLSTRETLSAALEAGADHVGLVFFAKSPRNVTLAEAASLAGLARGRASIVALLVEPDDALVAAVATEVRPDLLQLHGGETPERVAEIAMMTGIGIIKSSKVETADDAKLAKRYRSCVRFILFDAKAPKGTSEDLPGGNGVPFDWRVLEGERGEGPFMLSGGLTSENVVAAIRLTGASMVDVSSGVERAPGDKDVELIRRFVRAAKDA